MDSLRESLTREELDFLLKPLAQAEGAGTPSGEGEEGDPAGIDHAAQGAGGTEETPAGEEPDEEEEDTACGEESGEDFSRQARCFAELLSRELSDLTRSFVRLEPAGEEEALCGDFLAGLDGPASFFLAGAAPLAGRVLFVCDAGLTQALADVSLGAGSPLNPAPRPLSSLDRQLVRRCLDRVPGCLTAAFGLAAAEPLRTAQYGSDIFLTDEDRKVRVLRFFTEVESVRGVSCLAVPLPDRS